MELQNDNKFYYIKEKYEYIFDGAQSGLIQFSSDGMYFAYYINYGEHQEICVIQLQVINQLKAKLFSKDYICKFSSTNMPGRHNLHFIKKLKFDSSVKRNYLVGYGDTHFFVLNLNTGKGEIHEVDSRLYEKILDLNLTSANEQMETCYVVCKK